MDIWAVNRRFKRVYCLFFIVNGFIINQLAWSDPLPSPLDEGNTAENCIHAIQTWRLRALDGGVPPVDSTHEEIMQVCDYLANEDVTIWRDLYRDRTTQIIILASGRAVYGGLLDEVQFMALNRPFLTALEERQPSGFRDVFQWLQTLSPVDAAQEVEHALSKAV